MAAPRKNTDTSVVVRRDPARLLEEVPEQGGGRKTEFTQDKRGAVSTGNCPARGRERRALRRLAL